MELVGHTGTGSLPSTKYHPTTPETARNRPKCCLTLVHSLQVQILVNFSLRCWLVGCFGFNGPLRQHFSLYRAVSQREGERGERIDESKNVQTTPTRTYCKRNRPLPYCNQNCRTPRHWKFTQHHCTTRPPHFH